MSGANASVEVGVPRPRQGEESQRWQPFGTVGSGLPPALIAYFENLDGWRPQEAADCHSVDTVNARPAPGDSEGMARVVRLGREELAEFFRARGSRPVHHHLEHWAVNGSWSFVEGVVFDDSESPVMRFVSSAVVDDDGLVKRYVAARGSVLEARHAVCSHGRVSPDLVVEFLGATLAGDGQGAARLLSPSAPVDITDPSIPTDQPGRRLVAADPRAFARQVSTATQPVDVDIVGWAADGAQLFVEVIARRGSEDLSVLVSATVTRSQIARLDAHFFPAVPRPT